MNSHSTLRNAGKQWSVPRAFRGGIDAPKVVVYDCGTVTPTIKLILAPVVGFVRPR
jgi:hypothetical protein